MEPGTTFFFKGDWQTDPANWSIVSVDDEIGMVECVGLDGSHKGEKTLFHASVVKSLTKDT